MSGIQVSGLLSNSAFDWKSVVDQLIAVDSAPITRLNAQKSQNADKVTALANLRTALTDLQDSLQAIRADDPFSARSVSSDVSGTTWKSNSASGAAIGSYQIAVSQLATATKRQGAADIGSGLAATDDVTGLTIANLNTATAITAGTFTVNGQAISVALTDSLQDVFDRINTATGGEVTATYDSATDRLKLVGATGEVVLGASNDTSNFLAVAKLVNNGTDTINSGGRLGTVKLSSPLASAGLKTPITAVDGSGNGTFSINGVSIAYNVNTDSLSALITRINKSTAGVTAAYDSTQDRLMLTNATTGDTGMTVTDVTGGVLDALGLLGSSGTTTRGQNARFTVNGGDVLTSASNTLDATVHGITGLSVTVNTQSTQTVKVESDTSSMQTAIQNFVDKFNAVQDFIETNTKTTVSGNSVSTSVLTDNREVQSWASRLRSMAFDAVSGVTGSIQRLDNLGIDFDSTSGHLTIKNSDKLATALADKPDDVRAYFLTPSTGLVSKGYTYLTNLISSDGAQQSRINQASANIDDQIATLQSRLDAEREKLTNAFIAMLDAQSKAQSDNTTITNAFLKNSSSN
ncbi:MAG TPA: flagellar filament capping protein FliD [Opitutaceae bacterium]|nr:flagellar filament capping protein FliD [Opitutaceae bacterium]